MVNRVLNKSRLARKMAVMNERSGRTRRCCECKVEQPLTQFHVAPDMPQGRSYLCVACEAKKQFKLRWGNRPLAELRKRKERLTVALGAISEILEAGEKIG